MEASLQLWAKKHGERVRICCNVGHADVPRYLNAMDMLCARSQTTPRWREQFGRMLTEAMASGLAVIGSDSGEIPYVIDKAGLIVAEADELAWSKAIESLLASDERRRELGQAGRERAVGHFDWSAVAPTSEFFRTTARQPDGSFAIGSKLASPFFESLLDGKT